MAESDKVKMAKEQLARLKKKVKTPKPKHNAEESQIWGSGANYDGIHRRQD